MAKRYITRNENGIIAITLLLNDDSEVNLARNLFEISRTTDMDKHFDAAVHTLAVISAGIEGHRALTLAGECEDTDLPSDRYFRNAWEWED